MLLLDKPNLFPASAFSAMSPHFWPTPGDDESTNLFHPNWSFISPPPMYNFSFGDLEYDDPFLLSFPSDFSRPKLEPLKIYSPKPVFAYTTVHFDLARSFTPDVLEYTRPKPSNTIVARKRPRAVNSDVDGDRVITKRPKADDHVSGTRFAKMEVVRNLHATRKLGMLSSRRRN